MIEASPSAYPSGMLAVGNATHSRGGDLRRFDTKPHRFYGGIDLHAHSMYVCIMSQAGDMLVHRTLKAAPEPFLKAIAPDREGLVVAVECLFTWYWLADLWTQEGIAFVLGHALDLKAIHGGKAKHDTSDSHKSAALLRGGMLPHASVSPAEMGATRDLPRRRIHLMRQRAELLAHVHQTNRQDHRLAIGQNIADKANRLGVAERVADPAVQQRIAVNFALITSDDARLSGLELSIVPSANQHEAHTFYRLRSILGVGKILALVLRYDIHAIRRFPRVQDVVSSGRLVTCAKESAGKRDGTAGKKIGNAYLQWAFSEAAMLFLRNHPAGQTLRARGEKKHDKGQALTIVAHKLARAVYDMLKRETVCDMNTFLQQ